MNILGAEKLFVGGLHITVMSSFGLMMALYVLPGLAQDWDSETFVKQLDELQGNDEQLKNRRAEDPLWADYLEEIEPAYDEKGFPVITTQDPAHYFFSQNLNWSLTGRGEVPYLAIIYQFLEGETEEDKNAMWGVKQHFSCGGVLVSTERLITNCLCVASYFAVNIFPNLLTGQKSPLNFDLGWKTPGKYLFDGKINRIFVQYGSNRYLTGPSMPGRKDPANDRHLVDGTEAPDPDLPSISIDQECADLARNEWIRGTVPSNPDNVKIQKFANALALVPFWPNIKHPAPGQFVPWPPVEFNDYLTQLKLIANAHTPLEQVIITGIGYQQALSPPPNCPPWKLHDDAGQEIPLHKQAINLPNIHCTAGSNRRDEFTCRGGKLEDSLRRLSCFCDLFQPTSLGVFECKSIEAGVFGWPVIYQGNVVALTASIRDIDLPGNPILGSSLAHGRLKDHVETVLTRETIWKQRTERPPMFREDVAGDNYVFYDYPEQPNWFVHEGTTPKLIPLGLATHITPHLVTMVPFLSVHVYLTW